MLVGELSQEDQAIARNIEQDCEDQDPGITQAVIATDFKDRVSEAFLYRFSPRNSPNTTPPTDQVQSDNDDIDRAIAREFHPDHMEIPEIRVTEEDDAAEEEDQDQTLPQDPEPRGEPSKHPEQRGEPSKRQQDQTKDSIDDLLGPSTDSSTSAMDEDSDGRRNDLSRSNVMSQSSVVIIESSQDGDTSNEMGTRSEMSTDQTPPDPPTPLGALDHLQRQESSAPAPPSSSQQNQPPPPIVMVAPILRVQNPDLVMFNVAGTVTAAASIPGAQPDLNRTPDQLLIEVDLDYNVHHVLNFRSNYDTTDIVRAWFEDRVVIEANDEGIQTSTLSAQDSTPTMPVDEIRLATDFSRLNANLSSTNATAGSSQPSQESPQDTPAPSVGLQVTFATAGETPDSSVDPDEVPDLIQEEEEEEEGGQEEGGPRE